MNVRQKWWYRLPARLLYIAALVLLTAYPMVKEVFDDLKELFSETQRCALTEDDVAPSFTFLNSYAHAMASLHPAVDQVALLSIGMDQAGVLGNPCVGRAFMADLLLALNKSGAKVIAVDKFYGTHTCDGKDFDLGTYLDAKRARQGPCEGVDIATDRLRCAVNASTIPLVFGAQTEEASSDGRYSCLCASPGLETEGGWKGVQQGYVRLNTNPLQVPTRWSVRNVDLPNSDYVGKKDSLGFAMAAATVVQPDLMARMEQKWPRAFEKPVKHPFAKLEDVSEFSSMSALQYWCNVAPEADRNRWGTCRTLQPIDLRKKVVVVGADEPSDYVSVMDHGMFGYKVQAQYVASLLGGAYLFEWELWLQVPITILLLWFAEGAVEKFGIDGKMPFSEAWYVLAFLKKPTRHDNKDAPPVMVWVGTLCGLVIVVGWCSKFYGWLPPLGLMATAALVFLGKLVLYLKDWLDPDKVRRRREMIVDGGEA